MSDYGAALTDLLPEPLPPRRSEWLTYGGNRVHLEYIGDPRAPLRVVMLHGAGGHAGLLWPFAAAVAARGCYVLVPDLPGYGRTQVPHPGRLRYEHWVALAAHLLTTQRHAHDGPLVVVGASMGGMLGYDAATRTRAADALVATCLLDPQDSGARAHMTRPSWLGPAAPTLLRALAGPLARVRVPVRWLANMGAISNDAALTRLVVRDRLGGGNRVALGFLRSFLDSHPAVPPEQSDLPVVLAHPAQDRWTPTRVSMPFFTRLAGPTELVHLHGAGHVPIEQPGASQLVETIVRTAGGT